MYPNPASQIDTLSKSNDAYAWAGDYNIDTVSAGNGLNQLTATTPGGGQTSVPSLSYDSKGNLAGIGSSGYEYTSENRLATTSNGNYLGYGPLDGQLLQVKPGATDTRFHWSFDGRSGGSELLMEIDGFTGATLRRYVHGPSTGSGGMDEPIVAYEGSGLANKRYLTSDERGSIVAVSDSSGNVVATNSYDEYGNPGATNATVANGGRFGYTGQAWLPELQMWYYKARIYNPALGRFMQTDPIGYADGMNWYDYVGSDPVNQVDPSGLSDDEDVPNLPDTIVVDGRRTIPGGGGSSGGANIWARGGGGNGFGGGGGGASDVPYDPPIQEVWIVEEIIVTATLPIARPLGWFGKFIRSIFGGGAKVSTGLVFKTGHYAARLERAGVDVVQAELQVATALKALRSTMVESQRVIGRLTINGVLIEYRAMLLPKGEISVGTIFKVAQ